MVNQLVKPHPLPDEYPAIAELPDLGLEPDKSIDDYYGALVQLLRKIRQAGFGDDMPSESEDGDEDSDGDGADPHGDSGKQPKLNAVDRKASQVRAAWARLGVWWRAVPSGPAAQAPQSATAPARFLGDETGRGDDGGWRDGNDGVSAAGRYAVGVKVQRLQRLLVAVDTSGSIDQKMLQEFFAEIQGTWKVGATVVLVECDEQVQRSYDCRGEPPKAVKGAAALSSSRSSSGCGSSDPSTACSTSLTATVPRPRAVPTASFSG